MDLKRKKFRGFSFILVLIRYNGGMTGQEMREIMDEVGIGQTQLARWLSATSSTGEFGDRSIRRYLEGTRRIPPSLALMLELLRERPELKAWFEHRAQGGEKALGA